YKGLDFSLTSRNGQHVFLNDLSADTEAGSAATSRLCSQQYDICASLAQKKQGFLSLPAILIAVIAIVAFIIGAALLYAILSYLAERRSLE
ncbi:hypothetical protein, partial [Salmonella sp. SAL4447]|uniref:hypothetical protein n=1 Tax=Salmonella sp. SAL4447 TaxID=3159902 RepID=UPI00397C5799